METLSLFMVEVGTWKGVQRRGEKEKLQPSFYAKILLEAVEFKLCP